MRIEIGPRLVGPACPLFVIAEIGLNHGGSVEYALDLVDAAAEAGASAVKLQTIRADRLVAPDCPAPAHVTARSLSAFFAAFELDEEAHRRIAQRARDRGLAFMATPFYEEAVDLLQRVGCDALKIASGDITHARLIEGAAATGKPLVISTGMSDLSEIADAVSIARSAGAREIALLHCVSAYPVPAGSENLRAIAELGRVFNLPVGLSDHGTDPLAAPLVVALGGSLYERHVVRSHGDGAIDEDVSVDPAGLANLVAMAERARQALGQGRKACLPAEAMNVTASRRALYATRDLAVGEVITADAIQALRPATGLDARRWRDLVGRRVSRPIRAGAAFLDADAGESHEMLVDVA